MASVKPCLMRTNAFAIRLRHDSSAVLESPQSLGFWGFRQRIHAMEGPNRHGSDVPSKRMALP